MLVRNISIFIICLFVHRPLHAASIYYLKDLGNLGGTFSRAKAISENGLYVTGTADLSTGEDRAFLWEEGPGILNLGTTGAGESEGRDINDNKNVVGRTNGQPFRWTESGGMVAIDSVSGVANDLNEQDQVIGTRSSGGNRTLKWNSANVLNNPFPSTISEGVANNNNGEIAGTQGGGGYYNDGISSTRFLLGSFLPTDINDNRIMSGAIGSDAALLNYDTSAITTIGKLDPSDSQSRALAVSPNGSAVGESIGTGAFIYSSLNGLQDLTQLLHPTFTGWNIRVAEDITGAGLIVGTGEFGGTDHAVLLTPWTPGDFDFNGLVDGADLELWKTDFGSTSNAVADADLDGVTDGSDFLIWQRNFTVPPTPGVMVPEPALGKMPLQVASKLFQGMAEQIVASCAAADECEVQPSANSAPRQLRIRQAEPEEKEAVFEVLRAATNAK